MQQLTEHYLDNSATTPVDPEVARYCLELMTAEYGNPSSLHRKGYRAELLLEQARRQVAQVLGCPEERIVFTGSGTEANNLALLGAARARRRSPGRIVANAAEHSSVLGALRHLQEEGWEVVLVNPLPDGCPDIAGLAAAVDEHTLLVSCMAVNSETGSIADITALGRAVRLRNPGVLLHCDAVQGFARLPLRPESMGIDLLTLSGHKINAPKGVGALYIRKGVRLLPLYYGGGQEQGLRPGTQSLPLIGGLGLAVETIWQQRESLLAHYEALRSHLLVKLESLQGVCSNSPANGAPYIMNVSLPGYRSETVIHFLEEQGVYLSSGSACSKGAKSHVLTSMGLPDVRIDSALRISFGRQNTTADIDALTDGLAQAMARLARR